MNRLRSDVNRQRGKPLHAIRTTLAVGLLVATLFMIFTPQTLNMSTFTNSLAVLLTPQPSGQNASPEQTVLRIGVVAGHSGNDSGAVCTDANGNETLTEADVNTKIAGLVQSKLTQLGFQVDYLNEFDTRLNGYRAVALISIHNDSCQFINEEATGFKVAAALTTRDTNRANRLTACLVDRYHAATGLTFRPNSITPDMTSYHAFSEVDPNTVSAIIETGFLNLDRDFLTQHTDQVADGIVNGLLCFVNNESVNPVPAPTPVVTP